jgi:hypothetical protein
MRTLEAISGEMVGFLLGEPLRQDVLDEDILVVEEQHLGEQALAHQRAEYQVQDFFAVALCQRYSRSGLFKMRRGCRQEGYPRHQTRPRYHVPSRGALAYLIGARKFRRSASRHRNFGREQFEVTSIWDSGAIRHRTRQGNHGEVIFVRI